MSTCGGWDHGEAAEVRGSPRIGGMRALMWSLRLWGRHLIDGCPLSDLRRNYGNAWAGTAWVCECGRYYSTRTMNHYRWPVRPLLLKERPEQ